jgi:GTP cyclohydrolase IA
MSVPQLPRATLELLKSSSSAVPAHGHPSGTGAGDVQVSRVAAAFRGFLESLGLDLDDPDLTGTDDRVARAYREMLSGLRPGAEPRLSTFPNREQYAGIVSVTGIPFYSICAHHFLPFFGTAHVGYLPGERLLGLSKFSRVVDFYARRPQLQERLTEQVATLLEERLAPAGVIVSIEARHLCMEMRGVARPGVVTTTMAVRGALKDERLQQQFLARMRGAHPPSTVGET